MAHVFGGPSMHGRIPAEVAALAEKLRGMGVADVELNDMDVAGVYVTPEVDMTMPRTSSTIKVKTLTGKEVSIDIDFDDVVGAIKERIQQEEGIPPEQQRLIFGGKQLADDKTVRAYGLEPGSVFHLVLALRGGGSGYK